MDKRDGFGSSQSPAGRNRERHPHLAQAIAGGVIALGRLAWSSPHLVDHHRQVHGTAGYRASHPLRTGEAHLPEASNPSGV
jgi:hypothetical protein